MYFVFCFKQKTAYEMRISDWSSDVCSSDLGTSRYFQGLPPTLAVKSDACWHHCAAAAALACTSGASMSTRALVSTMRIVESVSTTKSGMYSGRSEERRGGKEWFSTCRSRWSPFP